MDHVVLEDVKVAGSCKNLHGVAKGLAPAMRARREVRYLGLSPLGDLNERIDFVSYKMLDRTKGTQTAGPPAAAQEL